MLSDLFLWSDVVLLCAFVLLIQFASIVRPLLFARQPLWKYALILLAPMMSLFSFVVAIHVNMFVPAFLATIHEHLTLEDYLRLKAHLSVASASCMMQTCLLVIMIVLLWCIKQTLKVRSTPAWVLARDIRL